MKHFLFTVAFFLFLASYIDAQLDGSFRIRSDEFIQIGYENYKVLTFGPNNNGSINNGGIGIEYWNDGLNVFNPWPNANSSNYLLFLRHDNFNLGVGRFPSSSYKLHVNGSVAAFGFFTVSDRRLKKNVVPVSNTLEKIKKVAVYNYSYDKEVLEKNYLSLIRGHDRKDNVNDSLNLTMEELTDRTGVMAQELQVLFPGAVRRDEQGYLSVNYMELIPVIIASIQEQQDLIEKLQTEINNLK